MRRFLSAGLVFGLLLAGAVAAPAANARTPQQSTTCDLDSTARFKPGLTLDVMAQKIKAGGKLTNCVGGGVSSAKIYARGKGQLSCTNGTAKLKFTITWNTSEKSKGTFTADVSTGAISGMVKSGKFAGEDVSGDVTLTPLQGDCVTTPVTKADVAGSLSA
jgi:hypothetical protein